MRNLWAFSKEGFESIPPENFKELSLPSTPINNCLGWVEIPSHAINQALPYGSLMKMEESYFGIVYDFVPRARLNPDAISSQLDFFHVAGFDIVPFNPTNWRGEGILIDFSDIVSPLAPDWHWRRTNYAKYQTLYHGAIQGLAQKGLLQLG